MNDYRNNSFKPDVESFKVKIADDDFASAADTMKSVTGGERISYKPGDINKTERSDFYADDQRERMERKEHKKRDKIKSHKNKVIFRVVWAVMVVLVALTLGSYLISGSNDFLAIGRSELGRTTVVIPEDITAAELAEMLENAGAIDEAEFFNIYCTITTDMKYFKPGTYEVNTNMDYEGLINYLQAGNVNREIVTITFHEGMTIREIAARFEEYGVASAQEILDACQTNEFDNYDMVAAINNANDKYYKLEGYLFPDTYNFYVDEEVDSVLGKMLYDFQVRVTSDIVEDIENSGYTMDEIITLASIIQAEAASVEDMYRVSAVLHNRLKNGADQNIYNLGCDSTYYYPYSAEDVPEGFTSDYNTYEISGLPAGPICCPGLDAIKAAVRPNEDYMGYFYFCHDDEGKTYFATTASEHEANLVEAGLAD